MNALTPQKPSIKTAAQSRRLWGLSGNIIGILVLLATLFAANIILGTLRLRVDLTEDKIFTLSEGTHGVLKKLDAPITLKLFFSEHAANAPMPLKSFARQVLDLLREYQLAAGGNILLETYDPLPDSDAEEWAERYGLAGQNLSLLGGPDATMYFGLVAVKGDVNLAIPFIDPRAETLLEYNITRLIARVANPRKPSVGVMSSLAVLGVQSFPYAMPGQALPQSQPPWVIFQNLADDYEIRPIAMDVDQIPADIDALIMVHPKNLSEQTQFAIDQFVLWGGRLLAFLDPLCLADAANADPAMARGASKPSSDLGKLLEAWGINYASDLVLLDMEASTRIRQSDNAVEDSPVFLSLREGNIDAQHIITANLQSLILPCAGAFTANETSDHNVNSLLVSSEQSQLVNSMSAPMGAEALRRDFNPGLKRRNIALSLQGNFKTAFPEGRPKAKLDLETNDQNTDSDQDKSETPLEALEASAQPTSIILVADVDMLFDQFAVQELSFFGQRVFQPINDNINFFINALEQLAGSTDLAQVRCRGRFERPFDRVLVLQHAAQKRWLLQERTLQEKLDATRQRLEALQSQKDKNQRYILSPEQEQEINSFKQEQIKTLAELKKVRKNLREGIEQLGVIVKVINIALMPILVILAGVGLGLYRRRQTKQ